MQAVDVEALVNLAKASAEHRDGRGGGRYDRGVMPVLHVFGARERVDERKLREAVELGGSVRSSKIPSTRSGFLWT